MNTVLQSMPTQHTTISPFQPPQSLLSIPPFLLLLQRPPFSQTKPTSEKNGGQKMPRDFSRLNIQSLGAFVRGQCVPWMGDFVGALKGGCELDTCPGMAKRAKNSLTQHFYVETMAKHAQSQHLRIQEIICVRQLQLKRKQGFCHF